MSEIAEPLEISRSAVLQHLQLLERSRLVSSEKAGRVRVCLLDPDGFRVAESWIHDHRRKWERRLDRLGEGLKEAGRKS